MGEGRTGGDRRDRQRLTVPEAATVLGVTVDAVRGRIRRGTLDSERESGTVYVFLDETGGDRHRPIHDHSELVEELRDRVRALEEANRENRRIIAGLTQRIPEIQTAQEPPQPPPEPVQEEEPPESTGGSRRPWWRFWR
jgi:hypothetical protein